MGCGLLPGFFVQLSARRRVQHDIEYASSTKVLAEKRFGYMVYFSKDNLGI
jgi:hypothetical protein